MNCTLWMKTVHIFINCCSYYDLFNCSCLNIFNVVVISVFVVAVISVSVVAVISVFVVTVCLFCSPLFQPLSAGMYGWRLRSQAGDFRNSFSPSVFSRASRPTLDNWEEILLPFFSSQSVRDKSARKKCHDTIMVIWITQFKKP